MAIQLIVGGSGTGKTTYMIENMIKKSLENNSESILYILPEQANMGAEQDMVSRHPNGGTVDISIMSFTRLSFMVFDELGTKTNDILDDYGKSMLIMKVLKDLRGELTFYKEMDKKQGFVDEIKSILSEFYQYQITEEILDKAMESLDKDKSLYYKLGDLKLILKGFEKELSDKYMVAEQMLSLLKEVASDSKLLKGASVYFDEFNGFTPVQYSVIEEFMRLGLNLYFSISMDTDLFELNDYGENELFSFCKKEVFKLYNLAEKNDVKILPAVKFDKCYRLNDRKALEHVRKHLFRYPFQVYENETDEISFYKAYDKEKEVEFVADTIKEYVMKKNYHYRDFAVVSNDIGETAYLWKHYMEQLEIPYFLDYSEPLMNNPVVDITCRLFEMFRTDFSYKSVFSFLKSGFLEIPMTDIYDLENYVLKKGVKGYSWWNRPFRDNKKGLKHINDTRMQFMSEIAELAPVFIKEQASAKEYLTALYDFMDKHNMAKRLYERCLDFEEWGMYRESKSYEQVYDKWIMVLDKTMDILGDEIILRDTLSNLLKAGMSDVKLGVIPSTLDQVVIGDLERTRLKDVKVLFVVGVNDTVMPKPAKKCGLLQDKERRILKETDILLAPDNIENIFMEQYYFYSQITKAEERIFISYYGADSRGAKTNPSYYLNRLMTLFQNAKIRKADRGYELANAHTRKQLVADFSKQMMAEDISDSSLYQMMKETCDKELLQIVDGYTYDNEAKRLNKDIIRMLYGDNMMNSVSKLETYSGCAYQYFLRYGLHILKRDEYKIENTHVGTILHGVMEGFFTKVKEENLDVGKMSEEDMDKLAEDLTIDLAHKQNDTIFEGSFRQKHQLEVLIRIAKRSIRNLCSHLMKGQLSPVYFEKKFSPEDDIAYSHIPLSEDFCLSLAGVVDRVDIKETEDAVYFGIIDYKSSQKDMDFIKLYEGKQLQLVVYMNVIREFLQKQYPDKKVIPTGMYYYHLQDMIVEAQDEETAEKEKLKYGKFTGLVNENETCRQLMDDLSGDVIPVRYKKDGTLASVNSSLVSEEELNKISVFVSEKMKEIGTEIIHGDISMNPEKGTVTGPCNFCDYKSICRFEAGLGGNHYSFHTTMDKKEARDKIMGKEESSDEMDGGSAENN